MELQLTLCQISNIANLSYEDETEFKQKIKQYINDVDINNITYFDACETYDIDAQIYAAEYKGSIIFAVRGTSSKHDILSDLYVFKKKFSDVITCQNKNIYKNIKVHSGFLQQYNSVKFFTITSILKQLWKYSQHSREKINVIFTSHSLGAAVSVLLSTLLKTHFGNRIHVVNYLFGCPKIGNKDFVRYYNDIIDETYRYVYKNDIIPRIPKINYKTTKNRIILGDPKKANWCNQIFGNVNDHSMTKYTNKFKKMEIIKTMELLEKNEKERKELENKTENQQHYKIGLETIEMTEIVEKIP